MHERGKTEKESESEKYSDDGKERKRTQKQVTKPNLECVKSVDE